MFLYVAVALVLVGLYLFALVDAARIPSAVWRATGRNKTAWIVVLALGVLAASAMYLLLVRRSLRAELADPPPAPAPPPDLSGGIVKCESCGFASNPIGAHSCRNCGERLHSQT